MVLGRRRRGRGGGVVGVAQVEARRKVTASTEIHTSRILAWGERREYEWVIVSEERPAPKPVVEADPPSDKTDRA